MIYRGGRPNVPAAVNRLTAAGKAARRRKATIYRDLYAVADAFARCGKANSPAAKNVSVVVYLDYHLGFSSTLLPCTLIPMGLCIGQYDASAQTKTMIL